MTVIAIERNSQLVDRNGFLTLRGAEFVEKLTLLVNKNEVLSGTGSPEGVVEAEPKRLYMDDTGTAGNILYVKKSGTGDTGWILV